MVTETIKGLPTKEPAFGLPALWITEDKRERAQIAGYTVVDCTTVMATHISEIIKQHAHELLGRQEAQNLIDNLAKTYPKLVEELVPHRPQSGHHHAGAAEPAAERAYPSATCAPSSKPWPTTHP